MFPPQTAPRRLHLNHRAVPLASKLPCCWKKVARLVRRQGRSGAPPANRPRTCARKERDLRLTSKIVTVTAATGLLLGATLATAPLAMASVSQGYVYGEGWGSSVNNDFGDEGPVDYNS